LCLAARGSRRSGYGRKSVECTSNQRLQIVQPDVVEAVTTVTGTDARRRAPTSPAPLPWRRRGARACSFWTGGHWSLPPPPTEVAVGAGPGVLIRFQRIRHRQALPRRHRLSLPGVDLQQAPADRLGGQNLRSTDRWRCVERMLIDPSQFNRGMAAHRLLGRCTGWASHRILHFAGRQRNGQHTRAAQGDGARGRCTRCAVAWRWALFANRPGCPHQRISAYVRLTESGFGHLMRVPWDGVWRPELRRFTNQAGLATTLARPPPAPASETGSSTGCLPALGNRLDAFVSSRRL
jgi:hypothetical protein